MSKGSHCTIAALTLALTIGVCAYKADMDQMNKEIEARDNLINLYSDKLDKNKLYTNVLSDMLKDNRKQLQLAESKPEPKPVKRQQPKATRGKSLRVPNVNSNFKSYMDIKLITSKSSPQYRFIASNSGNIWTDNNGCKRIGNDYLVALGTAYGNVGDRFAIKFSGGGVITVTKSEVKADKDTDPQNMYHRSDNSVVEFLVDTNKLNHVIKRDGGLHNLPGFQGRVIEITEIKD